MISRQILVVDRCRHFEPSASKCCDCASSPDGEQERHEGLYWFGLNVPTSSSSRLCSCPRFVAAVTNGRERDWTPKSLVECTCASVSLNLFSPLWHGVSLPLL
jgi:hypothetical protein